ncbi:MAG TPA: phosphomethylpyrimidine synthase, partial [Deltaproteobacteria bacterium]|nr:phosphomethylpyrimidine synthase [Deltaproteobacteria bacterium]
MTQLDQARKGVITEEMKRAALSEGVEPEYIRASIEEGTVIITKNRLHRTIEGLAVGKGLRTKVNANIGTSKDRMSVADEIEKLKVAVAAGADAVMDLSTGGPIIEIRNEIMRHSTISVGTVPIYQAAVETVAKGKPIVQMDPETLFRIIEEQAEEGVDFVTVHCGVTLSSIERLKRQGRIMDVVSRGGAFHLEWSI